MNGEKDLHAKPRKKEKIFPTKIPQVLDFPLGKKLKLKQTQVDVPLFLDKPASMLQRNK